MRRPAGRASSTCRAASTRTPPRAPARAAGASSPSRDRTREASASLIAMDSCTEPLARPTARMSASTTSVFCPMTLSPTITFTRYVPAGTGRLRSLRGRRHRHRRPRAAAGAAWRRLLTGRRLARRAGAAAGVPARRLRRGRRGAPLRRRGRPVRRAAPASARSHCTRFRPAFFVPSIERISRPVTSVIVIRTSPAGALFSQ